MNRNRIAVVLVLVAVAALVLWRGPHPSQPTTNTTTTTLSGISLQGVELCASNCVYPSPYLSATILVNGNIPLSSLHLFINGADEGITTTANTMTNHALLFKATPNNPAMPIIAGKTYTIMVVATFQDNSSSTASATVVAASGV